MNKKGDLSVNVIIVAALALIVLVILGVIFMGRMGLFAGQTSDCQSNGGQCRTDCQPTERANTAFVCPAVQGQTPNKCCIGVPGQ